MHSRKPGNEKTIRRQEPKNAGRELAAGPSLTEFGLQSGLLALQLLGRSAFDFALRSQPEKET